MKKFFAYLVVTIMLTTPFLFSWGFDDTDTTQFVINASSSFATAPMVATGFDHTVLLRSDGTVWSWGRNEEGQLGRSGRNNQFTPINTYALTNVTAVASHKIHSMALRADGTLWTWGWNDEGQLGRGSRSCATTPVQVVYRGGALTGALRPFTNVIAMDAGMLFSIALRSDGTVWAWGRNRLGTLGDGSLPDQLAPLQIHSPEMRNITAIAAGHEHILALRNDGTVWGIGRNRNGQLGDGSSIMTGVDMRYSPVQVQGLDHVNIVAIACGGFHSMALTECGHVYTWGRADRGQLGNGTTTTAQALPVRANITNVRTITSTSGDTVAVIRNDGTVWTWGRNQYGQLGDGTTTNRLNPVQVQRTGGGLALQNAVAISGGETHMVAILADGSVETWGANWDGQLGNDGLFTTMVPQQVMKAVRSGSGFPPPITSVVPLDGITAIDTGNLFTLALHEDGYVYGWGRNNQGQLVMQQATDHRIANRLYDFRMHDARFTAGCVPGTCNPNGCFGVCPNNTKVLNDVTAISAGSGASFGFGIAITGSGQVYGWGENRHGALGIGATTRRFGDEPKNYNPREMFDHHTHTLMDDAISISSGNYHTLIVRSDGTVWATGTNFGRLGDGTETSRTIPVQVVGLSNIKFVTASNWASYAISNDGRVWAWGINHSGQIGDGTTTTRLTPVEIFFPGTAHIVALSSNSDHVLALCDQGNVYGWGSNNHGHAVGAVGVYHTPTRIEAFNNVTIVDISAASGGFSLAVDDNGLVWTWGNRGGRNNLLGRSTAVSNFIPTQIPRIGGGNVVSVEGAAQHAVALLDDGTVWTWGSNNVGILGNGVANNQLNPVRVRGVAGEVFFDAGVMPVDTDQPTNRIATIIIVSTLSLLAVAGGISIVLSARRRRAEKRGT